MELTTRLLILAPRNLSAILRETREGRRAAGRDSRLVRAPARWEVESRVGVAALRHSSSRREPSTARYRASTLHEVLFAVSLSRNLAIVGLHCLRQSPTFCNVLTRNARDCWQDRQPDYMPPAQLSTRRQLVRKEEEPESGARFFVLASVDGGLPAAITANSQGHSSARIVSAVAAPPALSAHVGPSAC